MKREEDMNLGRRSFLRLTGGVVAGIGIAPAWSATQMQVEHAPALPTATPDVVMPISKGRRYSSAFALPRDFVWPES
jgi:hypothetical protein